MVHADIIVPRGGDNKVAIQLIVQHVHTQLQLVRTAWINRQPPMFNLMFAALCF